MKPRPATPDDPPMLARLHAQAWEETYPDLLPASEIAAHGYDERLKIWTWIMAEQIGRVWVSDDVGFAHFGRQREEAFAHRGYPEELFSMYLIRAGYGLGRELLTAAFGPHGKPFTACVLDGNARACAFYEKAGGQTLLVRKDRGGRAHIKERVYGWTDPPFAGDHP